MGDSACWLSVTCDGCGRVLERDRSEVEICPFCGADPTGDTEPATFAELRDAVGSTPSTPPAGSASSVSVSEQGESGDSYRN